MPNLETRFVAANTLIGLKQQISLRSQEASRLEQALRNNREKHFHATTRQQKRACKDRDEELRAKLATELKGLGAFADDADNIAQWDPYDQNEKADWFDAEWMFGITDGFDVVIGNPPYIQLQKEGGKLGNLYQNKGFDALARTGDIYCLFYEKAHKLSKNNGWTCLITSNKWMRAGYGKKLRDYLLTHTQPAQLLDMGPDVFDATVDTNILLFQNAAPSISTTFSAITLGTDFDRRTDNIAQYLRANGVDMEMPMKGEPWAILSAAELAIKRKVENVGKPLKDWDINISCGIKTGCNAAFIIDEEKRDQLIAQDPSAAEIIKPLLRGRDIKRYHVQWAGLYVIGTFPVLKLNINNYPAIKNYLVEFGRNQLEQSGKTLADGTKSRKKTGNKWFETQDQVAYYLDFEKEKIIYPLTTQGAYFFLDDRQYYLDMTCSMITGSDLKMLVGLLSSALLKYAYKQIYSGTVLGKKGYQYNKHALEKLPVVKIPPSEQHVFTALVDEILSDKHTNPDADTSNLENEIDKLVYALYGLTDDEIAIVERSI